MNTISNSFIQKNKHFLKRKKTVNAGRISILLSQNIKFRLCICKQTK